MKIGSSSVCAKKLAANASVLAKNLIESQRLVESVVFTRAYTDELSKFICSLDGRVELEFALEGCTKQAPPGRAKKWGDLCRPVVGHLDLFASFADGSTLAIELDRGNKSWSLQKLRYCRHTLGSESVWIRWKGDVINVMDPDILVVDITKDCLTMQDRRKLAKQERRHGVGR